MTVPASSNREPVVFLQQTLETPSGARDVCAEATTSVSTEQNLAREHLSGRSLFPAGVIAEGGHIAWENTSDQESKLDPVVGLPDVARDQGVVMDWSEVQERHLVSKADSGS